MSIRVWDKGPQWKQGRTAMKLAQKKLRGRIKAHEEEEKAKVRRRDKRCRFPLCGCRRLGLALEVSHDSHKGMGGNRRGDRSVASRMVYLCKHRHQDGRISRHKGTLRAVPLTPAGYDGPVRWEILSGMANQAIYIPVSTFPDRSGWVTLAEERAVQELQPLEPWQETILELLAEMEL